ncbi:hypothetical protein EXN66_Car020734 [Channa argus]|uniref:Uncharacterized protein n=1 Tax=Channa argus TaxID=215402 RepID=A0A6G1QRX1_CHAAH|nr:hypothetical protein EXN66_Car020734 [Channa argus]
MQRHIRHQLSSPANDHHLCSALPSIFPSPPVPKSDIHLAILTPHCAPSPIARKQRKRESN